MSFRHRKFLPKTSVSPCIKIENYAKYCFNIKIEFSAGNVPSSEMCMKWFCCMVFNRGWVHSFLGASSRTPWTCFDRVLRRFAWFCFHRTRLKWTSPTGSHFEHAREIDITEWITFQTCSWNGHHLDHVSFCTERFDSSAPFLFQQHHPSAYCCFSVR